MQELDLTQPMLISVLVSPPLNPYIHLQAAFASVESPSPKAKQKSRLHLRLQSLIPVPEEAELGPINRDLMASAPTAIQQPLNLLFQALLCRLAINRRFQIFLPHLQAFQLHLRNHARGKGSYWHPASGNGSTGTHEVVPLPKKRNERL